MPRDTKPAAFALRHVDTQVVRGRFRSQAAAAKASWTAGRNADGLDHVVVGLDRAGLAFEIEVPDLFSSNRNATGWVLTTPCRTA